MQACAPPEPALSGVLKVHSRRFRMARSLRQWSAQYHQRPDCSCWFGITEIALSKPSFVRNSELFAPPRIAPGLAKAIRFPIANYTAEIVAAAGVAEPHPVTVGGVFHSLFDVASSHISIDAEQLRIVIAYVIYTWLADRFSQAPYLSIVGPLGSGKTQLLRFLNCCCRRPLLLSDISVAGLYSSTDSVGPTLLIDEADFGQDIRSRELLRLLRAGHTADGVTFRQGKAYNLFGPKVICSRTPIPDVALASRTMEISMWRCTEEPTMRLDPLHVKTLFELLQPQLLRFRLRNYRRELSVKSDLTRLSPRSRDLARALAGPLSEAPELQAMIVETISRREPDAMSRQSDEPELIVLNALFINIHGYDKPYVTVGVICSWVNRLLLYRGEHPRYEPRGVGPILRQLGFATQRFGAHGIGILITSAVRAQLHRQAATFGMGRSGDDCAECNTLRRSRSLTRPHASPKNRTELPAHGEQRGTEARVIVCRTRTSTLRLPKFVVRWLELRGVNVVNVMNISHWLPRGAIVLRLVTRSFGAGYPDLGRLVEQLEARDGANRPAR